jgi:aspartyl-tRNA(Asn)/glutamyl-tRNA(Gln) amidotransferase subunit A
LKPSTGADITAGSDAATLARAFAARQLSPVEHLHTVRAHIARWEPHIAALWAADADAALAAARASEQRWMRGAPLSPLDGVPVTVKDNIATAGTATPLGTAATALLPAAADAPPAARLREAGAVLLAKTTMPDLGMLTSGLSSFHALTRNPWNLALNPGGSSAGAGAAAAAGYGPLHIGTDIGGSIRLPAHWCGVVGLKPSAGRVPIFPPYLGRVAGPLARTVADVAAAMAVLSRPDARDATRLPSSDLPWAAVDRTDETFVRSLRIGVLRNAGWGLAVDSGVAAAVDTAVARLQAAGAVVQEMPPFLTPEMAEGIERFWQLRSHLDLAAMNDEAREQVLPFIRRWVAPAAGFDAATAFHGYTQFGRLRDAAVAACGAFDFVVSPVTPTASFPAGWAMPSNDPARSMVHIGFTLPFNASEQPAVSVPTGAFAGGLPVGLQIAGARHDDIGVLRLARAFERLRGPLPAWPEPPPARPTQA